LGDDALAGPVGLAGEVLDQFGGIVCGGLHRLASCGVLGCRCLQKRPVNPGVDVLGQQVGE
jgi:hypothetical protein